MKRLKLKLLLLRCLLHRLRLRLCLLKLLLQLLPQLLMLLPQLLLTLLRSKFFVVSKKAGLYRLFCCLLLLGRF